MSTAVVSTGSTSGSTGRARGTATGSGLTFAGILRSEWIKLRSLRSTFWCYALVVLLTIGLAALIAGAARTPDGVTLTAAQQQASWIRDATLGINFSQLVVAVLGALVITGEYGTGMIRSSFAAVPSRLPVVFAKALVFGVTSFVVSLISLVIAAVAIVPIVQGHGIQPDLGDGNAWLALIGGAGYLAIVGVLALGIGLLVRSSAAGIATSVGLLFIAPIVLRVIGSVTSAVWPGNIATVLPSETGAQLYAYPATAVAAADGVLVLEWWQALIVLVAWAAVVLAAGCVLVKRRDA